MTQDERTNILKLTRREVRCLWRAAIVAITAAALIGVGVPSAASADSERTVTVMTRNMDEGTDLDFILAANSFEELLAAVAQTYEEVVASNIPERAAALAREIRDAQPDLVGLQEATIWRTGPGFDPKPARKVAFDPLESLLEELGKLGLHYATAVTITDFDFELP